MNVEILTQHIEAMHRRLVAVCEGKPYQYGSCPEVELIAAKNSVKVSERQDGVAVMRELRNWISRPVTVGQ